MPKVRKMINFDLDTEKYKDIMKKESASPAYYQIRHFMENNNFLHRQGSCYVSTIKMDDADIFATINIMAKKFSWLNECVKECDVTDITKRTPLKDVIREASNIGMEKNLLNKSTSLEENIKSESNMNMDLDIELNFEK